MSSQQRRWFPIVKYLLLVAVIAVLSQFLSNGIYAGSAAQRSDKKRINGKQVADKEPQSERTSFSENGPTGRWSGSILPDLSRNSSNSPVVVVGTSMLMGNSQMRNLQLTDVTLKNYSTKTVLGVQLKWFVTTKEDRLQILTAPGYTGLFEAYIPPGDTRKVECPLVRFSQAIKYLVTNNSLEGSFLVHIRAFQVEFEDGTTWNDDWGGPKPGDQGEPWRGAPEPNSSASQTVDF